LLPTDRLPRLGLIVTPATLLRWHRDLLHRRWARRSRHRPGRPAAHRNIKVLVLRLARETPGWDYRRIHGELAGLGIRIAASIVWEILKAADVEPAPVRDTAPTWRSSFARRPRRLLPVASSRSTCWTVSGRRS